MSNRENRARWAAAINEAFGSAPPHSAKWIDIQHIVQVLTPFMGLNDTMMPGKGGSKMLAIAPSWETGCLEFRERDDSIDVFRPGRLYFEYFRESPWDSFFLLETQPLHRFGASENNDEDEEMVEISSGNYVDPAQFEMRDLELDEHGNDMPFPTIRRVTRRWRGKYLVVATASFWNLEQSTYDGRHNQLSAEQIRELIQQWITPRARLPIGPDANVL